MICTDSSSTRPILVGITLGEFCFGVGWGGVGWGGWSGGQNKNFSNNSTHRWFATVVGANNAAGKTLLKNEYRKKEGETDATTNEGLGEKPSVDEGLAMAVKVLNKTMDTTVGSKEKMELFVLTRDEASGKVVNRTLTEDEKAEVIKRVDDEASSSGDQ